jgi:polyvinyl alcohol dehydrogenase (cytochrome)
MFGNKSKSRTLVAILVVASMSACTKDAALEPVVVTPTDGKKLYDEYCSSCHEGQIPKAPHRDWLAKMAPDAVVRALTVGSMQRAAENLEPSDLDTLTEYLTGVSPANYAPPPGAAQCVGEAAEFDLSQPPANAGWGYDAKRFVSGEAAGFTKSDVPDLKLKWAFAYPGAVRARSLPVTAMGAIFVGSQDGTIYAFDLETGCARWTTRVSVEVRTAIVVEPWTIDSLPGRVPRLFFGDLMGRVHALDATTGEELWSVRADDHPNSTITGTPVIHGDRLFVPVSSLEVLTAPDPSYECCTFRGSVVALDIENGETIWKHYTIPLPVVEQGFSKAGTRQWGPSGAAVWGSPSIDVQRGLIYFGSSENYSSPADKNSDAIFAVDLSTGERRWSKQLLAGDAWNAACYFGAADHPNCPAERGPDYDFSASPLLVDGGEGRQVIVAGQKSGMVYGLDPDRNGDVIWESQVGHGGVQGGVHFGMSASGNRVFVPITDIPVDSEGRPIEGDMYPGIHGVDAATGEIAWRSISSNNCDDRKFCDPGVSAAATSIPGVVFAGHLDGMLRAYDAENGDVLWQFDTSGEFAAVNGKAAGGSIGGPGPAIGSGAVIVNSGYDFGDHMPGNALLIFTPGGR